MLELGLPSIFVNWIKFSVTTVSYRYLVNGFPSTLVQAKRWLRQGDPVFPLLSVLVMEYPYRVLGALQREANFNYHPKCEKLNVIIISFRMI